MDIQRRWKAFRPLCFTAMWIAVTGVSVRQCEMEELKDRIHTLEDRILQLEERPTVKVNVDRDGKAGFDGDD